MLQLVVLGVTIVFFSNFSLEYYVFIFRRRKTNNNDRISFPSILISVIGLRGFFYPGSFNVPISGDSTGDRIVPALYFMGTRQKGVPLNLLSGQNDHYLLGDLESRKKEQLWIYFYPNFKTNPSSYPH